MAHGRRKHVPGGIYLVSSVGQHGQAVFVDDGDRMALGELVGQVVARCGALVHAYRWLENEILIVLQVHGVSLSGVMRRISSVHARRVNAKLGYKGNLFQHPHRAMLLEGSDVVLEAVATVHRGSEGAWSSHHAYLGLEDVPWLTKRTILELLSTTPELQVAAYTELMNREEPWQQALCLQTAESARNVVSRSSDQFIAWLKARSLTCGNRVSLDELIEAVARWFQVAPEALESTATSPLLSLARALITWAAMQYGIASLADLGQRFDRCRSTLHETRETYRVRVPQLFRIPLDEILAGPSLALSEVLRLNDRASSKHCYVRK